MYRDKKSKEGKTQKRNPMVVVKDHYAEQDSIGYSDYGEGLVEMIRSVEGDGSFTIGVFGQWGQGKTSMLRQIKRALDSLPNETSQSPDDEQPIITAWFNPWQFTKEEHIIIPFFHTLVYSFKRYIKDNESRTDRAWGRMKGFFDELLDVPKALVYGLEAEIKIPLLLKAKFNLKDMIDKDEVDKLKRQENCKQAEDKLIEKYESLYYHMITKLEEKSKGLNLKVVVFIDDLDRCLPERAVELLEGIKVLLDLPNFVFVIGVARDVIERGIRVRYHDLYMDLPKQEIYLEEEYLDKIIQFPFNLPAPDNKLLEELVQNLLKKVPDVKPYLNIIHEALGNNPRCLKRFVNNLSYIFWVAGVKEEKSGGNVKFHPFLLVKMTLISFLFPRLYHIIGRTPSHLIRIQEYLPLKTELDNLTQRVELSEKEKVRKKYIEKNIQNPEGFPEIESLDLFKRFDTIMLILGDKQVEKASEAQDIISFEDEKEVLKYASLLTATSKAEESYRITFDVLRDTIAKRMIKIPSGKIKIRDERSGNIFNTNIKGFLLDKYSLTQGLYRMITGENPSHFESDDRPVERISWFDAVNFCNLLSEKLQLEMAYNIEGKQVTLNIDSNGFRLPTEIEWEYACRAGNNGGSPGSLDCIAWYAENSNDHTHSVGQKMPNKWGLYDMIGNVWEWCWDWYGSYPWGEQEKWVGPESGERRVMRGGSWFDASDNCRCSYRHGGHPVVRGGIGFRLARSL